MIKNKKLILTTLFILIGFTSLYAASIENSRIGVFCNTEGSISEVDSMLLAGSVKDKIEANLKKYTSLTIVSTNIPELKNIQKSTQETGMDKNTAVRMGKIMAADSILNATIRKNSNNNYAVSLKIIDLSTGELIASCQTQSQSSDSIWVGYGCSIDLLTIELCDLLNIELSASQKYVLRNGEKDLSSQEQLKLFQEDSKRYQKLIDEFNKEISLLDYSSDIDAKEKQLALQTQKEIAEQKLESSLAAKLRMEELYKIQLEEDLKENQRSEEQKHKRSEIEALAEKKAQEVRNQRRNKSSTFEEIAYIENEKRVYLEIQNSINLRIKEIQDEAREEIARTKEEINNQPYRKAHLGPDGRPIEEARKAREKEIKAKTADINNRKEAEIEKLGKSLSSNTNELLITIDSDSEKLAKKKRKASSITDDLSIVVGLYDGSKRAWIANLYFVIDGRDLYHQKISLPYEAVTGKTITSIMDNDYLDTVDLYDSLFTRGTPVVIFEMEYTVEALPKDRPSMYKFNFESLDIKYAKDNFKTLEKQTIEKHKVLRFSPAYDIRTKEELKRTSTKEESKYTREDSKVVENKTEKVQTRKEIHAEIKKAIKQNERNSVAVGIDFPSYYKKEYWGFYIKPDFSIAGPLYGGLDFNLYSDSERRKSNDDVDLDYLIGVHGGLNFYIPSLYSHIFSDIGIGYSFNYCDERSYYYSANFGVDIAFLEFMYNIHIFPSEQYYQSFSIGIFVPVK